MREIKLEAKIDNIEKVTGFVEEFLEEISVPIKTQTQIDIAIDELFSNIAHYAYEGNSGDATVRVCAGGDPVAVEITFIDQGQPYNPLEKEDPDVTLSAEERNVGGLGIFMVKQMMTDMNYEYKDGSNILTIRKVLE